jgi:hypothetical protein
LHSATALKAAIADLRELGPSHRCLADQLRCLARGFDMVGIRRLLAEKVVVATNDSCVVNPNVEAAGSV